jgi:hypothetical protein
MGSLEAEIDASFYNLVHQLSTATDGCGSERRRERRLRFVSTQRVALRRAPGIPDESEFIEIQCHDLTRKGFSFFLPSEPSLRFLVVALGIPPNVIYISARITHTEPVLVYDSGVLERLGDGGVPDDSESRSARRMVLVGCTFVDRLTAPGLEAVEAQSAAANLMPAG